MSNSAKSLSRKSNLSFRVVGIIKKAQLSLNE